MHRRTFLARTSQAATAFGVLRYLEACRPGLGAAREPDGAFTALRDRFFLKALELAPVTATYLGGDGYDPALAGINGRLRDWDPKALTGERSFYHGIERELAGIAPTSLSPANAVDHAVLSAELGFLLHQLEDTRWYERAVDTYVAEPFRGVDWQIQGMSQNEGMAELRNGGLRGTEAEWRLVVQRLKGIPAYLEVAKQNLLAGKSSGNVPDHRMIAKDGITGAKANADYFRKTLPESAKGFLGSRNFAQSLLTDLGAGGEAAARAWESFADFLGSTYDPKDASDRFAAGEKEYEWRVHHCLQDARSAQELFDYGAQQVELYEERLFAVAQEVATQAKVKLSFGTDAQRRASTRAVMDWLSRESPRDDDELFRWYREAGERAVAYGRDRQLFEVPADYRLEVTPTPPVLRSTIDAAYYPAPPFKHSGVGRFYLTPTGNDPAALKLNNHASVADTAVHEGFPGHDWHYKYMTQHAREISNIRWLTPGAVEDSSSMWQDSMATEGWGLYSEELMAEPAPGRPHGFYTAAEHFYELQGQLLRAVRVRVDVGIHTGRMGFDEAVDYFTAHVGFYPGACAKAGNDPAAGAVCQSASRALYRYSKWPTQAITYNLGKNAIVDLREAVRARQGGSFSARAFHEGFMRMGTIPVGYFRTLLLV
jgi:uncharacterized protein (DUF885 family)